MGSTELTPFLRVEDARAVVAFYKKAFGAVELSRQSSPAGQFIIELSREGDRFFVVDENPAAFNVSPTTLGERARSSGTPTRWRTGRSRWAGRSSFPVADPSTERVRAGSPIRRGTTG